MLKKFTDPFENRTDIKFIFILRIFQKIINLFLFILFKILNIKLFKSSTEAIGHQCIDIECFKIENPKPNFNILILNSRNHLANNFFFDNFQKNTFKYIEIKNNLLSTLLFYQRKYKNINFDTDHYATTWYNVKSFRYIKNFKPYTFKKELIPLCLSTLKKFDIKFNEKNVMLHIRDFSFKKFDGERYRDSDINNYLILIKYLIKQGYTVYRLGNFMMKDLKFSHKNYFDLTKKRIEKSDKNIIDTFLIANTKYFIGTSSGLYNLSVMFGKKSLITNIAPLSHVFSLGNGINLPKLYKSSVSEKYINFEDVIKFNFDSYRNDEDFKKNNIKLEENKPEDILNAFKELEFYQKKENFYQKKFRKLFIDKSSLKKYSVDGKGYVSNTFLKKYNKIIF